MTLTVASRIRPRLMVVALLLSVTAWPFSAHASDISRFCYADSGDYHTFYYTDLFGIDLGYPNKTLQDYEDEFRAALARHDIKVPFTLCVESETIAEGKAKRTELMESSKSASQQLIRVGWPFGDGIEQAPGTAAKQHSSGERKPTTSGLSDGEDPYSYDSYLKHILVFARKRQFRSLEGDKSHTEDDEFYVSSLNLPGKTLCVIKDDGKDPYYTCEIFADTVEKANTEARRLRQAFTELGDFEVTANRKGTSLSVEEFKRSDGIEFSISVDTSTSHPFAAVNIYQK